MFSALAEFPLAGLPAGMHQELSDPLPVSSGFDTKGRPEDRRRRVQTDVWRVFTWLVKSTRVSAFAPSPPPPGSAPLGGPSNLDSVSERYAGRPFPITRFLRGGGASPSRSPHPGPLYRLRGGRSTPHLRPPSWDRPPCPSFPFGLGAAGQPKNFLKKSVSEAGPPPTRQTAMRSV